MEIITRAQAIDRGLRYYYSGTTCKNGHTALRRTKNAMCSECQRIKTRNWGLIHRDMVLSQKRQRYQDRKAEIRSCAALNHQKRRGTVRGAMAIKLGKIKTRCSYKAIPYAVDTDHLEMLWNVQEGKCALSGMPMRLNGRLSFDSCSVDRIEPDKGYVAGNVRLLCSWVNAAKGTMGDDQFMALVEGFVAHRRAMLQYPTLNPFHEGGKNATFRG